MALLEATQRPFYGLLFMQNLLSFTLLVFVAVFITLLAGAGLFGRSIVTDPAFLGVALVTVMNMSTNLTHFMNQWASLEVNFEAVSRVKDFTEETPDESMSSTKEATNLVYTPISPKCPPSNWPSQGKLNIRNWSAYYTRYVQKAHNS